MVDNYVGSIWQSQLTRDSYRVIWQQNTPAGIPEVSENTLVVMVANPLDGAEWPSQTYITIPLALLEKSAGEFVHVRNRANDNPII